ncbi:MAG TPA: C40 family peptidase [Mycobacteriales bacterium]|nr:C40 family peptidase [Mycobacteriales bacterium]
MASLLAGGFAGGVPGVAVAAPGSQSPGQVQAQLKTLMHKVEVVTEKYDAATDEVAKKRAARDRADATARALNAKLGAVSGKVRQMASATYRAVPFSEFTALMTSSSPQQFLNQLSALDVIARKRGQAVATLRQTSVRAGQAQQRARQAAQQAQELVDSLAAQKASLDKQVTRQKSLLATLTFSEQQAVFASAFGSGSLVAPDVPATGRAEAAVAAAKSMLGVPYVTAGASPSPGFDCSGLTMWVWEQAGVSLPHHAASQYGMGPHVPRDQLQPGDLVFFFSPISHVGIYIGDGMMIHAPTPGDVVKVAPINEMPFAGATRVG